ncbi:phosphopantetheine-binding protein [Streptomyces sp. NPDC006530]|uniref:phosphopantetheine-binding protein n=1 Tax=Streptomyces sp. NPDC006530 TaxID=3364750 RepID=UPI00369D2E0B
MPTQRTKSDNDSVLAVVIEAWRTSLSNEKAGLGDNFFSLGGNSLMALRIANHISTELGVLPPIRLLFEHSDLEDYARELSELVNQTGQEGDR